MANTDCEQRRGTLQKGRGNWQLEGRCCAPYAVINVCKARALKAYENFSDFLGSACPKSML